MGVDEGRGGGEEDRGRGGRGMERGRVNTTSLV